MSDDDSDWEGGEGDAQRGAPPAAPPPPPPAAPPAAPRLAARAERQRKWLADTCDKHRDPARRRERERAVLVEEPSFAEWWRKARGPRSSTREPAGSEPGATDESEPEAKAAEREAKHQAEAQRKAENQEARDFANEMKFGAECETRERLGGFTAQPIKKVTAEQVMQGECTIKITHHKKKAVE